MYIIHLQNELAFIYLINIFPKHSSSERYIYKMNNKCALFWKINFVTYNTLQMLFKKF